MPSQGAVVLGRAGHNGEDDDSHQAAAAAVVDAWSRTEATLMLHALAVLLLRHEEKADETGKWQEPQCVDAPVRTALAAVAVPVQPLIEPVVGAGSAVAMNSCCWSKDGVFCELIERGNSVEPS